MAFLQSGAFPLGTSPGEKNHPAVVPQLSSPPQADGRLNKDFPYSLSAARLPKGVSCLDRQWADRPALNFQLKQRAVKTAFAFNLCQAREG